MKKYCIDIPDEELANFACADEVVNNSGMSYDSPAFKGRSGWAMKILVKRGKAELFLKEYPKFADRKKEITSAVVFESENSAAFDTLMEAVLDAEPPKEPFALEKITQIILKESFAPNEDMMEKVDAFIIKIPDGADRKKLEKGWNRKLLGLCQRGIQSQYLQKKLLESLATNPDSATFTCSLLIKQKLYPELTKIFPALEGHVKADILRQFPRKDLEKVPQGAFDIAWLAVADDGESISTIGINYLADNYSPDMDFLRKAWDYEQKITDEAKQKRFIRDLWSSSYSKIGRMSIPDVCAVAAESPTQDFVKQAIETLSRDSDRKTANFAELAKLFPSISNERNRFEIMRQMKDISYIQFAFRKPDELKIMKSLFDMGMNDKSREVRAAALDSSFQLGRPDYPDEQKISTILFTTNASGTTPDSWRRCSRS